MSENDQVYKAVNKQEIMKKHVTLTYWLHIYIYIYIYTPIIGLSIF